MSINYTCIFLYSPDLTPFPDNSFVSQTEIKEEEIITRIGRFHWN